MSKSLASRYKLRDVRRSRSVRALLVPFAILLKRITVDTVTVTVILRIKQKLNGEILQGAEMYRFLLLFGNKDRVQVMTRTPVNHFIAPLK